MGVWTRALGLVLLIASLPSLAATVQPRDEVIWDTYGVPHVYASSEAGVFYGFGWAQVKSHGNILLKLYGQARGRAAEYWGAQYLDQDRWLVSNDVYARSKRWYAQQPPQFRKDLDAFARGINDYARQHPKDLDPDVLRVLPITGVDVVAHAHRLMNYVYIASQAKVFGQPPSDSKANDGSNAWALAPQRTRDGHAMLLANPHLPWAPGFFTYYEAHLNGPGINLYGATQIGLPILRFAFNNDLGFTNTVNTMLGATVYKLTLDGDGYRFDGQHRPFTVEHKSVRVRQADGSLREVDFDVRQSVHGPVFERHDGATVALRVAGLDRPGMLKQYWDMGLARNFEQFQQALRRLQVPMFNIVYADRAGNVMYLDNGVLPKRRDGSVKTWSGLVAGDTSETLWDPKYVLSYEELPKVINPPGGFVQNTNDAPWLASWPRVLDPKAFPGYVSSLGPMSLRAQTSVLSLAGDEKLSFEDFIARKRSVKALSAERVLPELLPLAQASSDPQIQAAGRVLAGWDQQFDAQSRGGLLYEAWARELSGDYKVASQDWYATPWSLDDPLATPRGLKDPQRALAALKVAAQEVNKTYGALDVPFGDVSRFRIGDVDVPGRGGFGNLGVFDVITWDPPKDDGKRLPQHGETWVSLVEFSTPLKAKGLMSYGNSTQPGTRHNSDQLAHLAKGEYRDLWFTRAQVEQHIGSIDTFQSP